MLAERQRLSLYTRFLPKIVVCGEEIPSEFKSHKNQKIVLLQQVYSKEKKKKNTFVLLLKVVIVICATRILALFRRCRYSLFFFLF